MSHERPVAPFSDLHVNDHHVRAVLMHDPTVEGLDMAIYVDGSGSMEDEYQPRTRVTGGFWKRLFGKGVVEHLPNIVEPEVQRMLGYLATKDRNGTLRVAYWATGQHGDQIEDLGELTGANAASYGFEGPKTMGGQTVLVPAMRDFVAYMKQQASRGARQGCAVFITDGQLHDGDAVTKYAGEIAKQIVQGRLPRMNFILVGVGGSIDEEQMERICHHEYPGIGHLWCHRVAAEVKDLPELVAVLVDETMTVAAGGTIWDYRGNAVKVYEARLPAVLEFEVPEGCKSFTLEVNGQRFTQPMPEDDEHHGEEEDHDDDHH